MRLRTLAAAMAAVLALAGLAGCKSNVGTAATVDGQRISESDVSSYITPSAKSVDLRSGPVSPRSFVLLCLINERFGVKIMENMPAAARVTSAQLDAKIAQEIGKRSATSVAERLGLKGYTAAFYRIFIRFYELQNLVSVARQNGIDVDSVIRKLDFPVSVNPRYGSWDKKHLSFNGVPSVPSYLKVQPGPGVASSQATQ